MIKSISTACKKYNIHEIQDKNIEVKQSFELDESGRKTNIYILSGQALLLLATQISGKSKKGFEIQLKLVQSYHSLVETLSTISSSEYKEVRKDSKKARLSLTDVLQLHLNTLIREQNSESSYLDNENRVYMNYSKIIKIHTNTDWNDRDELSVEMLKAVEFIEHFMSHKIIEYCDQKVHYKEIYSQVSNDVKQISQTALNMFMIENNQLLPAFRQNVLDF
jgi:hypothetical protein